MQNSPRASLIIPCYNEGMWLEKVISSLLKCRSLSEIIAVNDGSTDKTLKILKSFGSKIMIISYSRNHGKGYALCQGTKKAQGEIVVFLDAHVLKVKNQHFTEALEPLLKKTADSVLVTTACPPYLPDIFWSLTGFRAYKKSDILPLLPEMAKTRFGVEIFLNEAFREKNVVLLKFKDIIHLAKQQKMPPSQAFPDYLKEAIEVIKTYALIKGISPKKALQLLSPKKIKTFNSLKEMLKKINDKDLSILLKKYLLSYLK